MKKSKSFKTALIVAILCLIISSSFFIIRYNNAFKTAENIVAIYLAKNYNSHLDGFNSFNKIYSSTKFKNFNSIVEFGGNVSMGYHKGTYTIYSKVKINLFTNKAKIETLKIEGRNKLK